MAARLTPDQKVGSSNLSGLTLNVLIFSEQSNMHLRVMCNNMGLVFSCATPVFFCAKCFCFVPLELVVCFCATSFFSVPLRLFSVPLPSFPVPLQSLSVPLVFFCATGIFFAATSSLR